jgi:hypothetical protein
MPWLAALAVEGKCYQVRIGNLTTPVTGNVNITDTAAEMAAEASTGYVIIPFYLNVQTEAIGGTLPECALKSVGALITTISTAFVPLNLKIGGPAATGRASIAASAGAVTVAAELATTTRRHFAHVQVIAAAALPLADVYLKVPPVVVGPGSVYLQVSATTTGCTYFAHFDYAELTTAELL